MEECPISDWTTFGCSPRVNRAVAKVCRSAWMVKPSPSSPALQERLVAAVVEVTVVHRLAPFITASSRIHRSLLLCGGCTLNEEKGGKAETKTLVRGRTHHAWEGASLCRSRRSMDTK